MKKMKLSKSIRKFIRLKKAELRKLMPEDKVEEEIKKILKEKFGIDYY
mgnify:CR=1 FL=1